MARSLLELRKVPMEMTVSIKVTRELRIRMWLAISFIRLAMWVIGGRANIDIES